MLALTRELNLHGVIQTWGCVGEYEMLSSVFPVIVMIDDLHHIRVWYSVFFAGKCTSSQQCISQCTPHQRTSGPDRLRGSLLL